MYPWGLAECVGASEAGAGATGSFVIYEFSESNLGPLQEQYMLLSNEPFIQFWNRPYCILIILLTRVSSAIQYFIVG